MENSCQKGLTPDIGLGILHLVAWDDRATHSLGMNETMHNLSQILDESRRIL